MKEYPSIPNTINTNVNIFAFSKHDGSMFRSEWSRKKGFHKFGTKTQMIDENTPIFGEAVPLFLNKYNEDLSKIFVQNKLERATCFGEFYGQNSFAGIHQQEPHTVTLFDVAFYKQGIIPPEDFIEMFGNLDIPNVVYYGKANQPFVDSVRRSEIPNMAFEGVVCKARNPKKTLMPVMFKVKTQAWLDKLKGFCKDDEDLYRKLE